jgi:hypothetical protein
MHRGSVSVICITFGGFTLLDNFCQLFEALTARENPVANRLPQPTALKLYTKAAVKANPPKRSRGSRAIPNPFDKGGGTPNIKPPPRADVPFLLNSVASAAM